MDIRRGEIYYADLNPAFGSEQGGYRPVLILQNNIGNKYSPTTIIAPLTTRKENSRLPTHVSIMTDRGFPTIILLEQIRILDKRRLHNYAGRIRKEDMELVNDAIKVSLGLNKTDYESQSRQ